MRGNGNTCMMSPCPLYRPVAAAVDQTTIISLPTWSMDSSNIQNGFPFYHHHPRHDVAVVVLCMMFVVFCVVQCPAATMTQSFIWQCKRETNEKRQKK